MNEQDKFLESYKNLAALYIQVDDSVMTRHKFFLTIIIAIFTAIGLLIYQSEISMNTRTPFLINIASILGFFISLAWLLISFRGLYLDRVLSEALKEVEQALFDERSAKFRAFTIYNQALTTKTGIVKPECYESRRMEHISMGITSLCLLIFLWFLVEFNCLDLKKDLWPDSTQQAPVLGSPPQPRVESPQKEEKEKITNSPINTITINLPPDISADIKSSNTPYESSENSTIK